VTSCVRCPGCRKPRSATMSTLCRDCVHANDLFLHWLRCTLRLDPIPRIVVRIRKRVPREPLWKRALEARKMAG
jgi:hypothetical protein